MARSLTTKNLYEKKPGKLVKMANQLLTDAIGAGAQLKGLWLIYGNEKNGKSWFTLQLAKAIAAYHDITYVSGEEGTDDSFKMSAKRAGITMADRIKWSEYLPFTEVEEKFKKAKSSEVIVMDNATVWADEIKPSGFWKLAEALPSKLIIVVAHEERKFPVPACAKHVSKMAKVIINVKGLEAFVTSRYSAGGQITINEEKSEMYWGAKA